MVKEHFSYLSNDHVTLIHAIRWIPDGDVRAVLQIVHGMVEHVDRYDEFAGYLSELGILVIGNDHLGHGESVRSKEDFGYFAEHDGNKILLKDIHRLRKMTEESYPGVPYFLLGHSMGSFLTRQYLCCCGKGLAGAVIMGTAYHSKSEMTAALAITQSLAKVRGWRHRSRLVDALAFGGYSKSKRHPRTDRDWLSKDDRSVDCYIGDERCQFMFTLNAYYNMFLGLYKLTLPKYLKNMPKDIPLLFAAGENDPVGNYGKGVRRVYEDLQKLGVKDMEIQLYPEDRHELLHETDKEKVFKDIAGWIENHIKCTRGDKV